MPSRPLRTLTAATCAVAVALLTLLVVAPSASAAPGRAPQEKLVRLLDDCDNSDWPEIAPGVPLCTSDGSTTFPEFTALLAKGGSGAWWINDRNLTINAGDTLHVVNQGGLPHTFTEVSKFGLTPDAGGFVPAGMTTNAVALEPFFTTFVTPVGHPLADGTVAQLPTERNVTPAKGVHMYQCFLHPWMQTTVTVR